MTTLSHEEIQAILAPLDEYYAATPSEFSIGLQNFQSIRQYTKIPTAPITLIYGQNSAGKSAIHDAFIFLNDFLSNKSIPESLDRWANRQRINRPLSKGFVGRADDVVISIDAYAWGSGCFEESSVEAGQVVLSTLWGRSEGEEPHKFQLRFHFNAENYDDENFSSQWFLREFHLFIGADEFIHYQHLDGSEKNNVRFGQGYLSVNTKHLLFAILGQLWGQTIDEMAKVSEFCNGEFELIISWNFLINKIHMVKLLVFEYLNMKNY
jgi:hypothetical protein